MKLQIKHQTVKEVDFEFPSFYKAVWLKENDTCVHYAMYSEDNCLALYWDGSVSHNKAENMIEALERYSATAITREQFRIELERSCESLIQQTY